MDDDQTWSGRGPINVSMRALLRARGITVFKTGVLATFKIVATESKEVW